MRAFLFLIMAVSTSTIAQPRLVTITDTAAVNPNEVSVVINPSKPDQLVAVSMQFRRPDGSEGISNYAYLSNDFGKTWVTISQHNPERRVQGDDAVTVSASGVFARSYISFDGIRQKQPRIARNGIFVSTSADGFSWGKPVPVVDHINTVRPFEDKPWPAFDAGATSPWKGRLYLSWTRFDEYASALPGDSTHIYFTYSADSGRSFIPPFRISDQAGTCLDDGNTVEGAVPAAGPDGTVYVAWSGPSGIVIDRSTDGGRTFGKDLPVTEHVGGWSFGVKGNERHNGMPVLKINHAPGPDNGTLYIAFMDRRHGDADVFLTSSKDKGQTWTQPLRVNSDKIGNGLDQAFCWLAVDPVDGSVNLVYYDRSITKDGKIGATLARSTDGGRTFKHFDTLIPPFEFEKELFFGDYIGIEAHNGRVVTAITHVAAPGKLAISATMFQFEPGRVTYRKTR